MSQGNLFDAQDPKPQDDAPPETKTTTHDEHGVPPISETLELPARKTSKKAAGTLKRIVLIDGHALAYRSYFGLQRGPGSTLATSTGEPTQAIFGFLKTLLRLLRDGGHAGRRVPAGTPIGNPEFAVIVVFDPPVKTFRHEQYPDYKAGRAETPDDLPEQVRKIKQIVDWLGLVRLEEPGFEADDVIGTLAVQAEARGLEVRILTSDRDAYQLLSERVRVIASDGSEVGPQEVFAKYGVRVDQWVDYRALTGDSSDNIPGAKGIGPKGAQKLLEAHNTLQHVLDHLNDIPEKKEAQKIQDSLENVIFSRELSRIVTSVNVSVDFEAAALPEPNAPALSKMLRDLEFNSFVKDLGLENRRAVSTAAWVAPTHDTMWGFVLSNDQDAVGANLQALAAWDAQANSARPAPEGFVPTGAVSGANVKALAVHGQSHGVNITPNDDPLLLAYVLDPANNDAAQIVQRYLDEDWSKDASAQAAQSHALFAKLRQDAAPELWDLYHTLEKPVSQVLAAMETRGVQLDVPFFQALSGSFATQLTQLERDIWDAAGEEFNVSSRDQLEHVLYDKLQLASGKKTKLTGKRSTAVSALEPLREEHPIVGKILEYREVAKLRGTYLEPLPAMVNARTGRLHTVFDQLGTATGRISSINPNLQNIPVRTAVGREIRKGFVAAPGFVLLSADYSQIELRILAHITQEPALIEGFRNDEDIHRRTAAAILNKPLEAVTNDERRSAKAINYGILYGMGAHRLAGDEGISYEEAKRFIDGYFAAYPGIRDYLETTKQHGRKHGYVKDLLGRRRYIPEMNAKVFPVREAAERAAINMPIQGTSAGIIKHAMVQLEPELLKLGARLLLQVHDELVLEAPTGRVDEVAQVVKEKMENAFPLSVPLGVGVGVGESWYDAK